jgi:Fe-S-cluster-containing dehydrogenase component
MCYDRTSAGKKPMCATVCPSGALFYGTREQIGRNRPNSSPVNTFRFGRQLVKTKVNIMMPKGATELVVDSE